MKRTFATTFFTLASSYGWNSSPQLKVFKRNDVANDYSFNDLIGRRAITKHLLTTSVGLVFGCLKPEEAKSANLPKSNGADMAKTGSIEKLRPIIDMQKTLQSAKSKIADGSSSSEPVSIAVLQDVSSALQSIPSDEVQFKKIFDEYSDPVSYKQKFLDQNAFLVYYTKGYDGPNRPSIEGKDIPLQTLQYGSRNDSWNAYNDFLVELTFAKKESISMRDDLLLPLDKTISAITAYIALAPIEDVQSIMNSDDGRQ